MTDISDKLTEISKKFEESNFKKAILKGWYDAGLTGQSAHHHDLTDGPKAALRPADPLPPGYTNDEYARLSRADKQNFLAELSNKELSDNARFGRCITAGLAGMALALIMYMSGCATTEYNKYSYGIHQQSNSENGARIAAPYVLAGSAALTVFGLWKKK